LTAYIPQGDLGPVVLVDDSADDILIARRCYRRSGLSNPFITFDGGRALLAYLDSVALGEASMPALLLLDINMPDIDGFESLRTIRSREPFRELPVVMMLTNSDDPRDRDRAAEAGASGLQVKPTRMKDYVEFFASLAA